MATLSSDGKYVTVERGDSLWKIAATHLGSGTKYKQLAAINNIPNPDFVYVGQKIYLTKDGASGSGSTSSANSNKPTINQFGEQSNAEGVLFATWSWSKSNTESYKVLWTYDTGGGIWFEGTNSTITVDEDAPEMSRQSVFNVPSNAVKVRFKVKPISKKKTTNGKETSYWTANWSDLKTWTDSTPLETPSVPSVQIDKYKLTATLNNIEVDATGIEFEVVKDNAAAVFKTGKATIVTKHVAFSCTIDAGSEYKVRCRAYKGSDYSEWTAYSSNEPAMPCTPKEITVLKALDETTLYIEWTAVATAEKYDIEYTYNKEYFDGSNLTTTIQTEDGKNHYTMAGLQGEDGAAGDEFFFRVRAVKGDEVSEWCEPKSIKMGEKPSPPTTWSLTTTAMTTEEIKFYWVHNATDGSSQSRAELELVIGEKTYSITIINVRPKEDRDKTSEYVLSADKDYEYYPELFTAGAEITWRVRTAGVVDTLWSDWSAPRTINVYAPPSVVISLEHANESGVSINTVTTLPIRIKGVTYPDTQEPVGYNVSIISNETYDTLDSVGNSQTINSGDEVFSTFCEAGYYNSTLDLTLSAGKLDLENNISYTINVVASMNSGLSAENTLEFNVIWADRTFEPNAEISVDTSAYTAAIRPYCAEYQYTYYKVTKSGRSYTRTDETLSYVCGESISNAFTGDGLQVYHGVDQDGNDIYYCEVETTTIVDGVTLSVYRREFDGSFTELATDLTNSYTTIIDPHPSLDYARYRIIATDIATGAVSFYDPPGYPVGGTAAIVQWDEVWTQFDTDEASVMEQPPWTGSMLKIPYNIDVSDGVRPDVSLVEYIGRSHPVAYYGTQLGVTSAWNMVIPKNDKETLYALRRLARWMGNVYVREPSGSGYWANIIVSFSQKHGDTTIPVIFDVTRVEGGA